MIHVTANEAGRNAVMKNRLFLALNFLIDAIKNNTITKKELIKALKMIMYFVNRQVITQPTRR